MDHVGDLKVTLFEASLEKSILLVANSLGFLRLLLELCECVFLVVSFTVHACRKFERLKEQAVHSTDQRYFRDQCLGKLEGQLW